MLRTGALIPSLGGLLIVLTMSLVACTSDAAPKPTPTLAPTAVPPIRDPQPPAAGYWRGADYTLAFNVIESGTVAGLSLDLPYGGDICRIRIKDDLITGDDNAILTIDLSDYGIGEGVIEGTFSQTAFVGAYRIDKCGTTVSYVESERTGTMFAEWQSSQPARLLDTLVLAGVASTLDPNDPAAAALPLQPLADVLAANLNDYGITDSEVRIAPDYETLITWLKDGEVDLTFDDTYQAMRIYTESGAEPVLRSWHGGIRDYSATVFTNRTAGLFSLRDTPGRIMAFDTPTSPGGFMLPMFYLTWAGLNMVEKTDPSASVASDEVGYVFSGDDRTTISWVLGEQVAVGVVTDIFYDALPPETRNELTLISEMPPIARQVVIVRADFDPDLLDALIALMLRLPDMDEGQQALEAFGATKFDEFDTDRAAMLSTTLAMFETIQNR